MTAPTDRLSFEEVLRARDRIAPHVPPTPALRHEELCRRLSADVWVKHDNLQPVGAFKVRGGVNLVAQLTPDEAARGIIAASTGNHGLSLAYAGRRFGVRVTICMPERPNPAKRRAIEALGAEVREHGHDYDDAREHCEETAERERLRYVHSGDEPDLIHGVATATVELLEVAPDLDVLLVPIGGGSGAAAACLVASALSPRLRVIGVQSRTSPAAYHSWRDRRPTEVRGVSWAEGIAVRTAFALPQAVLRDHLHGFVLVDDAAIRDATLTMLWATRTLVEVAGAAALAAAEAHPDLVRGARVGLMCTGGNLSRGQLAELLGEGRAPG